MAAGPRSDRVPLLFMGGVCLFIAAIFAGIGGSIYLTEQQYQREGARTEAVVTGKRLEPATANTGSVYQITYRFAQHGGPPYEQTEKVSVHQWERVERGSAINIEYVAGQPGTARVVPESAEETIVALIAIGVGGVLGAIGLGAVVAGFRRRTPARAARGIDTTQEWAGDASPSESRFRHHPAGPRRAPSAWQLTRSSFGFWFGGIFLVCGAPFFFIALFLIYDDWSFAHEARVTQGMVLSKDIRVTTSGSGSNRSTTRHYDVVYRFAVNGKTYEGKNELSHQQWQRLREREAVRVLYRPGRPSSSQVEGRSRLMLKSIFLLMGSIFTGIGGTVFVRAIRGARREAHLRKHGVTTLGTILALDARNLKINNVPQWRLRYEYRDFKGERHEAALNVPVHEAQEWKVGETGTVLYDTKSPAHAVWLGREG